MEGNRLNTKELSGYKQKMTVQIGSLGLSVIATFCLVLFCGLGFVVLPVDPFSFLYLSKSPWPYLMFAPSFVVGMLWTYRQAQKHARFSVWKLHPWTKFAIEILLSTSAGIIEELERWSYFFAICLVVQFISIFAPISWDVALVIAFLATSTASFFDHGKRSLPSSLLLFTNICLYTIIMYSFGLFTAVIIHSGYDLLLDFTNLSGRLSKAIPEEKTY